VFVYVTHAKYNPYAVNFENWYFHRAYARETDHAILLFGFQA